MNSRTDPIDRRRFLRIAGGGALGISLISVAGCEFNAVEPITAGEEVSFLTPIDEFYYKNGAEISIADWQLPIIERNAWRLTIDGTVASPLELTFADIDAASDTAVEFLKTMRCVIDSNEVQGLVGTALWRGVPLRPFLEQAGLDRAATRRLRFYGADGFTNNATMERIDAEGDELIEPLLVTHMNDEPLPSRHGAPVRLMLNESFGYKNVKWLTRIEATTSDEPFGTYQDADFVDDGVMRVNSRTTDPLENAQIPFGDVVVSGFALSGEAGITLVEISVDGAPFEPVEMQTEEDLLAADPRIARALQLTDTERFSFPYRGLWRTWNHRFTASPGDHEVRVRATDAAGNVQPISDGGGIADGVNAVAVLRFRATR